jgi:two-component system response regulator YesN
MQALYRLFSPRSKSNSLFVKLMLGFLAVIIFLVALHFITISLMSDRMRGEIVRYNELNLEHTADSYEKHFDLVQKAMLSFFINEDVQTFGKPSNFIKYPVIQGEIRKVVANPLLYLEDILLYSQGDSRTLDRSKSTIAETMFSTFMRSEVYTEDFWKNQFAEPYKYKILPVSAFTDHTFSNAPATSASYFPIVFKGYAQSSFYVVGLLNAEKLFEQFHIAENRNLYILQGDKLIYSGAAPFDRAVLPLLETSQQGFRIHNDHYYFYTTGSTTGLTYINVVPVENISAQNQIKTMLLFVLAGSILVALLAAFTFIRKINNPLQRVIESLQNQNAQAPATSRIKEFDAISEQFRGLSNDKQRVDHELAEKNTMLRRYNYVNQLKDIKHAGDTSLSFANKPYVLVLFHFTLLFAPDQTRQTESRWYNYVKEFVDLSISQAYENAFSFYIEKNQYMSLIYLNPQTELMTVLEKIKVILDIDRPNAFATIAVSPVYVHSDELTQAYEETLLRLQLRRLNDGTEIIHASDQANSHNGLSIEQMRELDIHLREGNTAIALSIIGKILARLQQLDSPANEVRKSVGLILDKGWGLLNTVGLDDRPDIPTLQQLEGELECLWTYEETEKWLGDFSKKVCEHMAERKELQRADPIIDYVFEYVEQHYEQGIYLEDLAGRLKITSGYLSTYFKEKTGTNFVDYLNGIRISRAQELLNVTDDKVRDISQRVGYQNINSFNRMFKKVTGLTPVEYRKKRVPGE